MRELGRHGRHRLFQSLIGSTTPADQATRGNLPPSFSSLARHSSPAMRLVPGNLRSYRYYTAFVRGCDWRHPFRRLVVVPFYLPEIGGLPEAWMHVQIASVGPQMPVIAEAPQVATEFRIVDRVESHQRRVKPHVSLGDEVAEKEPPAGQPFIESFQGREQGLDGLVIAFLAGREASLVDAGVDGVEDQRCERLDLAAA